jgi:pheromone shutdown protein TraB
VIAAIAAVHPDVVMIELDEERLEFMRGPSQRPVLQQFQYTVPWKPWKG